MNESFLHYVWQFQYFDKTNLTLVDGESLSIFNPGILNGHAGPDFSNARIKIDDMEWVGNVEVHIKASEWTQHKHHEDRAYENVVLHVVWQNDKPVLRSDGSRIPTIELKDRVDTVLLLKYKKLVNSPEAIPCTNTFLTIDEITKLSMLDKALVHRLERKAQEVCDTWTTNGHNWEETCYQLLGRNFGFKVNADPFFQLAQSLPYNNLLKHADKEYQVEAFLFGQAGFLDETYDDPYYLLLKREHHVLSKKFGLTERKLHKAHWRFLRLRPSNFPTIRMAQFAALLTNRRNIFSQLIETRLYADLFELFNVKQSEYWQYHFQFSGKAVNSIPSLGKMSIDNIIINTVVPLLVSYGKIIGDQELVDRAIAILTEISAEQNAITKQWTAIGQPVRTAFDSQALIELYNNFCMKKKCLDCTIGSSMINPARWQAS